MPEPIIIEYLKAIQRPGGGNLVDQGADQRIATVAAGARLDESFAPDPRFYGQLIYRVAFGRRMLPDAFTLAVQQAGRQQFSGVLTEGLIEEGLWVFLMATPNQPLTVGGPNNFAIPQYAEVLVSYLTVASPEDLGYLRAAIADLATQAWGFYQAEALRLLTLISEAQAQAQGGVVLPRRAV